MRPEHVFRANGAGFTLVEVLVALAVVALALTALLVLMGRQLDGSGYLRDKQFAQWVALNELTLARLANRAGNALPSEDWNGSEELAGREWFYRVTRHATSDDGVMRLDVAVSETEAGNPLITVSGWIDRYHRSAP